jgi:GAF domain-containing protein
MTGSRTIDQGSILAHLAAITSSIELEEVVERTMAAMKHVLREVQCVISLYEDGYLRIVASEPQVAEKALGARLMIGTGLVGRAAEARTAIHSGDVRDDPRTDLSLVQPTDRSLIAVPLVIGDELIGCVHGVSPEIDAFSEGDAVTLLSLAPAIAVAFRNALLMARERDSWEQRRGLDAQKAHFMRRVVADLAEPLAEIARLCELVERAPAEDVSRLGEEVLQHAHALSKVVEGALAAIERNES